MLEITIVFLIAVVLFYVLNIIFKVSELTYMTLITGICAIVCVLKDDAIMNTEYVALFIIPLFFAIAMSLVKLIANRD